MLSRLVRFSGVLCFVVLFTASSVRSQVPTGTPPFGSYTSGPDVIDLANLNSHLSIPVLNKPGRGIGFSYDLVYDSSIWYPSSSGGSTVWEPVANWGWAGQTQIATGAFSFSTSQASACNGQGHEYIASNFVYIDPAGIQHTFFGSSYTVIGSTKCTNQGNTPYTGITQDGSGYVVYVSDGYATTVTITSPRGEKFSPPKNSSTGAGSVTDANGNEITVNSTGQFTDTLGQTALTVAGGGSSPMTLEFTAPGGATITYEVKYASETILTNFGCTGISEYSASNIPLVSEIDLPDGTKYTFAYEVTPGDTHNPHYVTGRVASIGLSTGGTINYTYTGSNNGIECSDGSTAGLTRQTSAGQWSYVRSLSTAPASQTTVTDPLENVTVMNFEGLYETQRQYYSGSSTLVQSVFTCYNGTTNPANCGSFTGSLPITQRSVFVEWPDSGNLESRSDTFYNSYGLVTEKASYGYGPGAPGPIVRSSTTQYASPGAGIVNRPSTVSVENASGTIIAATSLTYDGAPLTSITGVSQHNDASYGTSYTTRGNLTQTQSLVSGTTYLTSTATYDTTGQRLKVTNPAGNSTSYTFSDVYYTDNSSNPPQAFTPSKPTNAFVTAISEPIVGTASKFGYYFYTGQLASNVDTNGADSYSHYDSIDRLSTAITPAATAGSRGWTLFEYSGADQTTVDVYTSISSATPSATCTGCRHDQLNFDNFGRISSEVLVNDPDGSTQGVMTYDALGRVNSTTTPYRSTSDPTYGVEAPTYDALGRITKVTHADNSLSHGYFGSTAVSGNGGTSSQSCSTTTYGYGYPELSVNPNGKKIQQWIDALGRAIEVDEPDSSGNLTVATCYAYDANNNVTEIVQGSQTRTYTYDGLGRETSSSTPELGTLNIYYTNSSGGLCAGTLALVCRRTDARGITITNSYDALDRLTGTTYSDGTAAVQFKYDQTSFNGLSISNGKGRLTGTVDGSGQAAVSYDLDGRLIAEERTIGTLTKTMSYTYNLDDSIASIVYPSGRTVNYSYSNAQRTLAVTDGTSGTQYWSAATYAPHGQPSTIVFGKTSSFAGMTETFGYNNLLQKTTQVAGSSAGNVLNLTYGHPSSPDNDGQLTSLTNALDNGRNETMTYDPLNRISTAQSQATSGVDCWGQNFGYDRWGNLLTLGITKCSGTSLNLSVTNNKITSSGYSYNSSGDMLNDAVNTYTYDAEQRLTSAAGVNYTYDGRGLRVEKSNGTWYWRGYLSDVFTETGSTGATVNDYIYSSGMRIARIDSAGNVYYNFTDGVGSVRAIATSAGVVCYGGDFTPFGTEIQILNSCPQNYKFATYERDTESGLDYSDYRYYSSRLGRFLQPDEVGGNISRPQSLNRYIYALDNPCVLSDPLGLSPCVLAINIVNRTNIPTSQIQNQINALFGPNVSVDSTSAALANFTLTISSGVGADTTSQWFTMGDDNPKAPTVYVGSAYKLFGSNIPAARLLNLLGTIGAHELFHEVTGTDDIPFNSSQPNDLMSADANPNGRVMAYNNSLSLTPAEKANLLAHCQQQPFKGPAPPSALQVLVADVFDLGVSEVDSEEPNATVTTSQTMSMPAPCSDPAQFPDGCTYINQNPTSGDNGGTSVGNGDSGDDTDQGGTNGDTGNDDDGSMLIVPNSFLDLAAAPILLGLMVLPFAAKMRGSNGLRKRSSSERSK
jgi:RHS repeat-associated protein